MTHQQERRRAFLWVLVALSLALLLFSCNPANKARRYFALHPEDFAQNCADAFPVKESTDSAGYIESQNRIDSLLDAMKEDSSRHAEEKDIMMGDIDRLSRLAPDDCDSLSEAIYRYAAAETKRADAAEINVKKLKDAAKSIKPVIIEKENTARVEALTYQLKECIDHGLKESREKDFYKDKYEQEVKRNKGKLVIRIPWLLLVIAGGVLGIGFGLRLKGLSLNPIRWFVRK